MTPSEKPLTPEKLDAWGAKYKPPQSFYESPEEDVATPTDADVRRLMDAEAKATKGEWIVFRNRDGDPQSVAVFNSERYERRVAGDGEALWHDQIVGAWCAGICDLELIALARNLCRPICEELLRLRERVNDDIHERVDDLTYFQKLVESHCPKENPYGDRNGNPSIQDLGDMLVSQLAAATEEREIADHWLTEAVGDYAPGQLALRCESAVKKLAAANAGREQAAVNCDVKAEELKRQQQDLQSRTRYHASPYILKAMDDDIQFLTELAAAIRGGEDK